MPPKRLQISPSLRSGLIWSLSGGIILISSNVALVFSSEATVELAMCVSLFVRS